VNNLVLFSKNEERYIRNLHKLRSIDLTIIPSGIKLNKINKINSQTKNRVLYVGRLVPVKRIENLILSLSYLSKEDLNEVELIIVGTGYEFQKLNNLVKKNNLKEFVIFEGFQIDVDKYYNKCDIFVLPSDSEGMPIALLEAMSYGLPCIVNNIEIPISVDSIFILENNSPGSIALALTKLIKNPHLMNDFGIKAKLEIEQNFSISNMVDKHLNLYKEMEFIKK